MPVNFIGSIVTEGTKAVPYYEQIKTFGPYVAGVVAVKRYFSGANNSWERDMHGRVILITGGTSGLGAAVALDMASRGAQVILLVKATGDEWLVDYIDDIRERSQNFLVYTEECNLGDFYSIRKFATKWLDNSPPRRLDAIICCAGVALPPSVPRAATTDGLEQHLQINYLGHFHLLTLLAPSIRAQPPDRDVRVVLTTCVSAVMAEFDINDLEFASRGYPAHRPWRVMGASKLALTMFAYEFQQQLNDYERPDKAPPNAHVSVVDPGMMRSPSFKRFVSCGSLLGLFLYILLWPIYWLFLKASNNGAQSHLFAMLSPDPKDTHEVSYISECTIRSKPPRKELNDRELQKQLFEVTEKLVLETEKKSVIAKKREEIKKGGDEERASSAVSGIQSAKTSNKKSKKRK
ncbi:hypothetical protein TRICI_001884 [Trichomonascus ciferrii]|uniref:Ketoreductase (KR) domain-containing protein n=1 Tax=Trichomonascus ciferrii TaxID=44093 RepID=A0A642V8R4_9ASCO|nr:hypothetical protein TRICI_001884 [Trichomonascus ciferrii]